ncbi:MAG: tRNA pseudouridine(55) synthase TruB [Thermodesulfovibrionales bacterium]
MHCVINLNKPAGMTSHDAVSRTKRILRASKAGHAGTLDPMATGVLLVCVNEATKISRYLLDLGKEYRAVLKLGERTDTYDADGEIVEQHDLASFDPSVLDKALPLFRGRIMQRPPMYSAVKIRGKRLYALARKGIEIERPARPVEISRLEVVSLGLPYLVLDIACSKGTYIRSLAEDIGNRIGTGAHLVSLDRTGVGQFKGSNAVTFDQIAAGNFRAATIEDALSHLKHLELDEEESARIRSGQMIERDETDLFLDDEPVLLRGARGDVIALGVRKLNKIKPERVFNIPAV